MRIAQTVGTVTLARAHPSFTAASLRLVIPYELDELKGDQAPQGEMLVAWDDLGAGAGQLVAVSDGREAAQPFAPQRKPVDCYIAALLDDVELFE